MNTTLTRRMSVLFFLGATLANGGAWSADLALEDKRQRAEQLTAEAKALRNDAASVFQSEEAACQQRILVNDCINAAKEARLKKIKAARQKESEQATLTREIRYAEHTARKEAKARRHATEGPPAVVIQADPAAVQTPR